MTNAAKVNAILEEAKVFYFLTTDGDKPKGRPFGFKLLVDDKIYFGCGTFKDVFKQLVANPNVEIVAFTGHSWMRYDGKARVVKSEELLAKVREANPDLMAMYDKNGWEMGLYYLEDGHVEVKEMMTTVDAFDV